MGFKRLFRALLGRGRFWRHAKMSEVSEVYVSRMLRIAALNMMSAFIVIYLYQNGFSVAKIAFFWALLYGFKAVLGLPFATIVSWIGPKHATLVSNILYIPAMLCFALLPEYGDWMLVPALILQAMSVVLYTISHTINFSKVKTMKSAGKEIAILNIIEKLTAGLTPMVGGFLALLWGPQAVIAISAILFLCAAAPLFKTGEQVQTHQVLKFRGFPWRMLLSQAAGQYAVGYDVFVSGVAWSLFVAIIVIGVNGNEVYAVTGVLLSVIFVVALLVSYIFGQLVDRSRGKLLYQSGTIATILVHVIRPFASSTPIVAGINAAREAAHTAYILPYTRAVLDSADVSGARATYIGLVDVLLNLGAASAALILGFIAHTASAAGASEFRLFFWIAAGVMLLMLTARFPLYRK